MFFSFNLYVYIYILTFKCIFALYKTCSVLRDTNEILLICYMLYAQKEVGGDG